MSKRAGVINVALLLSILTAIAIFYKATTAEAKDVRIEANQNLKEHVLEEREEHKEIREDVRALYKYLKSRKSQERLEEEP